MRIAALALVCMWLCACASAPVVDEHEDICAVIETLGAYSSDPGGLTRAQDERMRAIPRGDLHGDVDCGNMVYRNSAPSGLVYVGVGFDARRRYAAVQTHTSDGQYYVAGKRCLLRRNGDRWDRLGCSWLYIS